MTASERAIELTHVAAQAAAEKKAKDLVALDVSERLALTDVFLVAAGANERQVGAIVDEIERKMHEAGAKITRREGKTQGRWVLLDFGDIVVHVQHLEDREFYALERLWSDCPVVELPADLASPPSDEDEWSMPEPTHIADDAAAARWWAAAAEAETRVTDRATGGGAVTFDAPSYDPQKLPGEPVKGSG